MTESLNYEDHTLCGIILHNDPPVGDNRGSLSFLFIIGLWTAGTS